MAPVDRGRTVRLQGHVHPKAVPQYDQGLVAAGMPIDHATLLLRPEASLAGFLAGQQMPGSPGYRRWLTPEQFGERFGLSANDLAKVVSWLESQGLKVDEVARGRHWINFSGTAGQASRTFHTEFHHFRVDGKMHFANTGEPEVPAALQAVIGGITGLNDFATHTTRPRPQTNLAGGSHGLSPDDLATIYNIRPLYDSGVDGTGQRIAIAGEVALDLTDIQSFRKRFGLPPNDPDVVLVGREPGPNSSSLIEADLDVEWAGAIARNAKIVYVYGSDAFAAARYAIDQNLAPVVSLSFGGCEAYNTLSYRAVAQQANAQGITFLASSGDQGAATCDVSSPVPQASKGARATFPASLPEITAVGGTMFNEGAGSYWASTNSSSAGSALSYIPEVAWNETVASGEFSSSGGGASAYYPKPFWQTGPGVPDDHARDTPDISLSAAGHDPYLIISRGTMFGVAGTSASTPSFAGIVALLNQSLVARNVLAQPGLGNINPQLYRLAQSAADAFHDITDGGNQVPCTQGSPDCINGLLGYAAGPGYDLVTGLGSVDAAKLIAAWGSGDASTTTVSADPGKAGLTDTVKLTVAVKGSGGAGSGGAPTGTVTFVTSLDAALGSAQLTASGSDSGASLSVPAQAALAGNGMVYALYSGDAVYSSSAGSVTVAVNAAGSGSMVIATLTPNPTNVTARLGQAPVTVVLSEKAGVATRLTSATFTSSSTSNNLNLNNFFGGGAIAANGTLTSTTVALTPPSLPFDYTFHLAGLDSDGTAWSRDLPIHVIDSPGSALVPGIGLSSSLSTVVQNTAADPSCQWSHQVTVRETGGFYVQLATLRQGATDLGVQQQFGTTRLAPFGSLTANICLSVQSAPGSRTYQVTGTSELGSTVNATLAVNYAGPGTAPATLTVPGKQALLAVSDSGQSASVALDISFTGGSPQWTAAASPVKPAWLTMTPANGTGGGRIALSASSAGLSRGVYTTTLSIQSAGSTPQAVNVPVTFVVGSSSTTVISGVAHGASFKTVFAPGMEMSVFGSSLAPSTQVASGVPLPLSLAGVSATVNGVSAPFYFVSPGQLNLQVPYETGAGTAVLAVNNNGQVASFPFQVSVTAPGIFVAQDGSNLLVPISTAKAGDTLLAFITGDGDLTPTLPTGATPAAGTAVARLPRPRQAVTMTIGGVAVTPAFAGVPSGLAGVTQINFVVPAGVPAGLQDVVVTVGGVDSVPAKLNVLQGASANE
jgi:uncharacterized protein (TIGR03437 family)